MSYQHKNAGPFSDPETVGEESDNNQGTFFVVIYPIIGITALHGLPVMLNKLLDLCGEPTVKKSLDLDA
jgi:hypothetical protein